MPETVAQVRVWVMKSAIADDGETITHPWNWADWALEPRLLWQSDTATISALGSAQFRLLRAERADQHDIPPALRGLYQRRGTVDADNLRQGVEPGAWIAITKSASPYATESDDDTAQALIDAGVKILDPDAIAWWGFIHAVRERPLQGVADVVGTVEALEVGHLLDAQQVRGWLASGTPPRALGRAPTANLEGRGGQLVGNAKWDATVTPGGAHLFASDPADCGTDAAQVMTRWRLLRHLCALAWVPGLPTAQLVCADGSEDPDPASSTTAIAGYLNDTTERQPFELDRLTYRGALDLLVPESHALCWRVRPDFTTWRIIVASSADAGYGMPAASTTAHPLLESTLIDLLIDRVDVEADEILLQGAPIRWCGSLSHLDGTWDSGWASAEETAYEAANPEERRQPQHADVFVRFRAKPTAAGHLEVAATPGAGGTTRPLCPTLTWDGTTLGLDGTTPATPYLPEARLLGELSWPVGLKPDGTDQRSAAQKALPTYQTVQLFHYDAAATSEAQWTDLRTQDNRLISEVPKVEEDDRGGASMRIAYAQPHALALDTFDETADNGGQPPVIDWRNLVVTVAIDSDQRLAIRKRRTSLDLLDNPVELADDQVRKQVVVDDERFGCWVAQVGTVLGVSSGQPVRVTAANLGATAYVLRSDWAAAERYAARLAARAFRTRRAVVVTVTGTAAPAWGVPGVRIGTIYTGTDGAIEHQVDTAVRSVQCIGGDNPRVIVTTDLPAAVDAPWRPGGGGGGVRASPTAGGSVSPTLGATVAQAVARLQSDVRTLDDRTRRRIVVPPQAPGGAPWRWVEIDVGNVLSTGQNGAKLNTTLTEVPTAYDPDTDTSFVDGVCRGRLHEGADDLGWVLIVNDGLEGYVDCLVEDDVVFVGDATAYPVGGGGTVTIYRPRPTYSV